MRERERKKERQTDRHIENAREREIKNKKRQSTNDKIPIPFQKTAKTQNDKDLLHMLNTTLYTTYRQCRSYSHHFMNEYNIFLLNNLNTSIILLDSTAKILKITIKTFCKKAPN